MTIHLDCFAVMQSATRTIKPHYPYALSKILAFLHLRIVKTSSFSIHRMIFFVFLHLRLI